MSTTPAHWNSCMVVLVPRPFFVLLLYCVIIFVAFFIITVEPCCPTNLEKTMLSCLRFVPSNSSNSYTFNKHQDRHGLPSFHCPTFEILPLANCSESTVHRFSWPIFRQTQPNPATSRAWNATLFFAQLRLAVLVYPLVFLSNTLDSGKESWLLRAKLSLNLVRSPGGDS